MVLQAEEEKVAEGEPVTDRVAEVVALPDVLQPELRVRLALPDTVLLPQAV